MILHDVYNLEKKPYILAIRICLVLLIDCTLNLSTVCMVDILTWLVVIDSLVLEGDGLEIASMGDLSLEVAAETC